MVNNFKNSTIDNSTSVTCYENKNDSDQFHVIELDNNYKVLFNFFKSKSISFKIEKEIYNIIFKDTLAKSISSNLAFSFMFDEVYDLDDSPLKYYKKIKTKKYSKDYKVLFSTLISFDRIGEFDYSITFTFQYAITKNPFGNIIYKNLDTFKFNVVLTELMNLVNSNE